MRGPHTAVGVGVHGLSAVLPPGDRTTTRGTTTAVRSSGTNSGQPSTAPPRAVRGLDSVIMASLVDSSPGRESRTTGSAEKQKTARPFLEEVRAKDSALSFRLKERSVVSVGSSTSSSGNEESDRHHRTGPCLYDALFPVPPASPQPSPAFILGEKRWKQEVKEGHRVRLPEIDRAYAFSLSLYPLEERRARGESSARDGNRGEKPLHHSFLLLRTRADPGNMESLSSAGGPTFYLFDSLEREFFLSPDIRVEGEYADVPPENSTEQTSFAGTRKVLWSSELALLGSPALRTLSAGTVRSLLCSAALLYVDEDLSQEWMPTLDSLAAFEASECATGKDAGKDTTSGVVQEQLDAWKDLWNSVIFRGELAEPAEEGAAVVKPGRGLPVLRSVYELPIVA
eukprot:g17021.t1